MRALDIDLDFFQFGRITGSCGYSEGKRTNSNDVSPWPKERVRKFLESQCGLVAGSKLPIWKVSKHHEVFIIWRSLIDQDLLNAPFELIHVDAHADFGTGTISAEYFISKYLYLEVDSRDDPPYEELDGINEGSYLLFAIANRWITAIPSCAHIILSTSRRII